MVSKSCYFRSASVAALATVPVILGCALVGATGARADYVAMIEQVPDASQPLGSDVVVTGSGAFDTSGLTSPGNALQGTFIQPDLAGVATGLPTNANAVVTRWNGASGPTTNIGPGGFNSNLFNNASSAVGPRVSTNFGTANAGTGVIYLPLNYVTGTEITSESTWDNQTFTSFGITPGLNETWTWGGGGPNQSFTICTGDGCAAAPSEIPAPAALPLFGSGLGALGLLAWRRKRRALAVA